MQVKQVFLTSLALLLGLTACGEEQELEGSLNSLIDLHYHRVEALASETELSVRFIHNKNSTEDTVLKVGAKLSGLLYAPGYRLDLATLMPDGSQRGTVTRSVVNETTRSFPELSRGTLFFEQAISPGATVSGDFHLTFVNGTEVYSGRTVFGSFEAKVP